MGNPEHLGILEQGVDIWNRWRKKNPNLIPDLTKASFLLKNFTGVDLSMANLAETCLSVADLAGANLFRANLSKADLYRAKFSSTDLREANLKNASFGQTLITDVDLRKVNNLSSARHQGPSYIDISTIYKSRGQIPKSFLRRAGVPDNFIEYMSSLTGKALDYYSCFISYSSKDQEFAERLYADLQNNGVRCWYAPEDIQGGKKIYRQLDEAIRYHDKLLLVLSKQSLMSDWVANEIKWARKRENESGKQKLFPITLAPYRELDNWDLFDTDTATDLAAEVRSYHIPNFTRWKDHDSYQKGLEGLLNDLKADS